jgi:UDP-2-acetamido-3-amino-2,3-dideoxy-glucuronate N-acetyltransferase
MEITAREKIACLGAGYWGTNLIRNLEKLGVLSWVCEADPERRHLLGATYPGAHITENIEEVLGDPAVTGVAIATPAETHGEMVQRALMANKNVFVEKPLCLSLSEGERLVRLAHNRDCILMVGHLLWYHPAILKLKELVNEGELGRIRYIYSNRLNLGRIRREENILWSFAPHDISVILGLVGEMPNTVEAQGGNYLHDEIADVTVSLLTFPSGVKAHIFVSWLHPFKEQKLIVIGDRKMAVFDDLESEHKLLLYPHTIEWKNHIPVVNRAEAHAVNFALDEPLEAECRHFLECIRMRSIPRTDGREGLRVLRVLQECQNALAKEATQATKVPTQRSLFVHASASIDEDVEIGKGTAIWHFSRVLKNSRIGNNCRIGQNVVIGPNVLIGNGVKIQNNVSVYEGVTLEDNVFCGPSMVFTNVFNPRSEIPRMDEISQTLIRYGATLGANCTIVCGVRVGQYAFVGAAAVVLRDVPDYALVVGNPGRIVGWMCECGNRIKFNGTDGRCGTCHKAYLKLSEDQVCLLSQKSKCYNESTTSRPKDSVYHDSVRNS